MIFKEIHLKNGKKKFMMGNSMDSLKEVTEETYKKLSEDEYINKINVPIFRNDNDVKSEYNQDTIDMVLYLKEAKAEEAAKVLEDEMIECMNESYLQGCIDTYNNLGKFMYKLAINLEDNTEEEDA